MKRIKLAEVSGAKGLFVDGDWIESKDQDPEGEVRLIQLADIGSGKFIDKSNRFLTKKKAKELKCTFLKKGDILVARLPDPLGRACLFPGFNYECVTAVDVCIIRSERIDIDRNWLMRIFNSPRMKDQINRYATGTTRKRISRKNLQKIEIPLPSLDEQKAIVAKLDRAQRLIDIDREMLAKYDDLIQSVFLDMFGDPVTNPKGWEMRILGEECGVGSSKRVFVKQLVESGIPFYRGQEIGRLSEGEEFEPELFITEDHYQELVSHSGKPEVGDLLMPSICPDGRIYIVRNKKKFYFKDGRVLWVKSGNSEIDSYYLKHHLKSLFRANYSEIASGTTFAELKIFALKKLQFLYPPVELQHKFQFETERLNKEIDKTKTSLKKSERFFLSMLSQLFLINS